MKWSMKQGNASLLLAGVIIARSTSFLLSKLSMRSLDPFNLLGVRFTLAFIFLLVIFRKQLQKVDVKTVLMGGLLGLVYFGVMGAELFGLKTTDTSTTSFLENTAIAWVPLMKALLNHRLPEKKIITSIALLLSGVGLLTIGTGGLHISSGVLFALLASVLYACAILLTEKLSRADTPLLLGIFQVGAIGIFSLITSCFFESPRLPRSHQEWIMLLTLAVVCSCFGFTLQPVAQRYVSAEKAGMFCALNPLTAAILGTVFLQEQMGLISIAGACMVLMGMWVQNRKKYPDNKLSTSVSSLT